MCVTIKARAVSRCGANLCVCVPSEYVFVAKKQKVVSTAVSAQQQEQVATTSQQQPVTATIPPASAKEQAQPEPKPATEVPTLEVAEPAKAVQKITVKKLVRRTRKVMRPTQSSAAAKKQVKKERSSQIDPLSMKVVELRAELKKRGLKAAGLKAVLIDRLLDALEEEENSDDDDVVELEEVDEEYEEEIEEEVQTSATATAKSKKASDEIVRESDCGIDETGLSQKSTADDSFLQSESTEKPRRALHQGAGSKGLQNEIVSETMDTVNNTEFMQVDDSRQAGDDDFEMLSSSNQANDPHLEPTDPTSRWAESARNARQGESRHLGSSVDNSEKSQRVQASSSAEPVSKSDSITGETDTSDMSVDLRGPSSAQSSLRERGSFNREEQKPSRSTISGDSLLEKKPSLKVSFATRKEDTIVPDSQPDQSSSTRMSPSHSISDDPVSRSRSISLPQASATVHANPMTPNGQMINDELQVARSEPTGGPSKETDDERRQREHQETIEREAQRLRIAAKLSAKKRFEEAKLSSAFWAKRDRLKVQLQSTSGPPAGDVPAQSAESISASKAADSPEHVAMKADPEVAQTKTASEVAATEHSQASDGSVSSTVSVNLVSGSGVAQPVSSLKSEPISQPRSKPVTIPFSSSNRRFSDPSRRLSASRRRESAASRRDSTSSTSSRRNSDSGRRDSLTRRRDSGASTLSSTSAKSRAENAKAAANASRKPMNLVSGLHSFTTLMEKESSSAANSTRSAPVVNALKLAEKTRLLEQKKNLEKMKRKEALMKKYEEQRKLDDEKKKKTIGLKEKTERDAKLKREQDKLNEKKQREIELAKKRHQKLQEMRAGLEKKRAMLAAEKQAGAARLAAQAASSARRLSTTSVSSSQTARPTAPLQASKPSTASQVLKPTASQAVNAPAAPKMTKPSAQPARVSNPAAAPLQTESSASVPVKKGGTTKPKDRPTDASTYDMSDNAESSESDGNDSEDEDKHNKKNIPKWARKDNLERILRVQFGPNASDPSPAIFPDFVDTCDLEAIFQPTDVRKKKRFAKRSSSGNWFGDRPTAREKAVYKRDMGYLR